MGISQLLPLLSSSTRECHIKEFRGRRVAVDAYCWLHKGAIGCALQLARRQNTDMYISYFMKYVNVLLDYRINPVIVFDGRHLPAKAGTEQKRAEAKRQAQKQAAEYFQMGNINDAYKAYMKCIDITPEMALAVIKECRRIHVDCIVAPYESDPQLAFFSMKGVVDCVISEDSDLLIFGCKKVLYKMDVNGVGQLIDADKINDSLKMMHGSFSVEKFRHMCILAGCDYLDSLPGIGIKKALKFVKLTAETNPKKFLDKLPSYLKMRHLEISEHYKEMFLKADAAFLHQIIYNPFKRTLEPLNPIDIYADYCQNAGAMFDSDLAFELAIGNINPLTMERIDNWRPNAVRANSIWFAGSRSSTVVNATNPPHTCVKTNTQESVSNGTLSEEDNDLFMYYVNLPKVIKDSSSERGSSASQLSFSTSEERPESPFITRNPFLKVLRQQPKVQVYTLETDESLLPKNAAIQQVVSSSSSSFLTKNSRSLDLKIGEDVYIPMDLEHKIVGSRFFPSVQKNLKNEKDVSVTVDDEEPMITVEDEMGEDSGSNTSQIYQQVSMVEEDFEIVVESDSNPTICNKRKVFKESKKTGGRCTRQLSIQEIFGRMQKKK